MRTSLRKAFFWLIAGFVVLFLLRLGYGYWSKPPGREFIPETSWRQAPNEAMFFENDAAQASGNFVLSKSNYASAKIQVQGAPRAVDQKYEKVASIHTKTKEFDQDEKRVRGLVQQHNAVIQYEQNSGLTGKRLLCLAIGVHPERFDEMTTEFQKIGKLLSINVDKQDKTNEYKSLEAKKVSLEKTRAALAALKGRSGKIEELINLEDRILNVEKEIQTLGVKLGEYDQENEFCTVKLTLSEDGTKAPSIPLVQRMKVAFEWTVKFYFMLMTSFFCGSLGVLIVVAILEKLKWIPQAIGRKLD